MFLMAGGGLGMSGAASQIASESCGQSLTPALPFWLGHSFGVCCPWVSIGEDGFGACDRVSQGLRWEGTMLGQWRGACERQTSLREVEPQSKTSEERAQNCEPAIASLLGSDLTWASISTINCLPPTIPQEP